MELAVVVVMEIALVAAKESSTTIMGEKFKSTTMTWQQQKDVEEYYLISFRLR